MPSMRVWAKGPSRLDLLYVVPGEANRDTSHALNRDLSIRGRQQLGYAAEIIKSTARPQPQAVLRLRHVPLAAFQHTSHLLGRRLNLPVLDDDNLGEGATDRDIAAYRSLPASTLVLPITPTGMLTLVRRLDPSQIHPDWLTAPDASVWHVRVNPSGQPTDQLVARLV